MNALAKLFGTIGAINMAIAVGMGAFGAHALKDKLSDKMLAVYKTAVEYHFYHALGLIAVAFIAQHIETGTVRWAGWFMLAGMVLFSGSLYLLTMTGTTWLGAITPIGGTLFIVSWIMLSVAMVKA